VLLYAPDIKPSEKANILNELQSEANIPHASPAVLQLMLDKAKEQNRRDFALKVAQHIVETFTETDYALDARMVMAEWAMEKAKQTKNPAEVQKYYSEAIKHFGVIRAVFATSTEACQALIMLGKLYRDLEKFEDADECFKSVLGVKGWRNYWPEALFERGEIAFNKREYNVSAAYYERIYVMYSHYRKWASKAYLRRAEALRRGYQNEKACEVLAEMRSNNDLAGLPEWEPAGKMMESMGCAK
jgi:tetratricopeptide (TPR) repeat protein